MINSDSLFRRAKTAGSSVGLKSFLSARCMSSSSLWISWAIFSAALSRSIVIPRRTSSRTPWSVRPPAPSHGVLLPCHILPSEVVVREYRTSTPTPLGHQIEFLRRELERKDAILLNMTEGLKSLEASREAPESPEIASETSGSSSFPPYQEKRSWLARFFGLQ